MTNILRGPRSSIALDPASTPAQVQATIAEYEGLINKWLYLPHWVWKKRKARLQEQGLDSNDVIQELYLVLLHCAETYDSSMEKPFPTFTIRSMFYRTRNLYEQTRLIAIAQKAWHHPQNRFFAERATDATYHLVESGGKNLHDPTIEDDPSEKAHLREILGMLREKLPPEEYHILDLYYCQERTYQEIGTQMGGISRQWVQKKLEKALSHARDKLHITL